MDGDGSRGPHHALPGAICALFLGGLGSNTVPEWDEVERLLEAMAVQQEAKLLALGRRLVPRLTAEDLLQPHDHGPLMESAEFNYEDGILAGIRAVATALRRMRVESP
jgi:hypothetical protein